MLCLLVQKARGIALMMQLRKAANHPLLIRNYYTDEMLSKMAQVYCKVPGSCFWCNELLMSIVLGLPTTLQRFSF